MRELQKCKGILPFPFPPPIIARTVIAIGKLVDMPQIMKHIIVLIKPKHIVGFRPMVSEAFPHGTAVTLCDNEKTAPVKPAHLATLSFGMPKLSIISGR